jgi:hypothetical protein
VTFVVVRQNGLLVVSGPAHDADRKHLFVILTKPKNDPSTHILSTLIVPICSVVAGQWHDPACILGKGDHLFLKHDSYANYHRALIEPVDKITHGVAIGKIIPRDAVTNEAFVYLCKGLLESKRTSPKNLQFFNS